MPSPPKPWERGGAAAAASSATTMSTPTLPATSSLPSVPARPAALASTSTMPPPTAQPALASSYASPYGYGSNAYSRYGSTYSPYGGMNGMYGGGGGGYGGYGGMGGYGMNGMYGGGMGPMYGQAGAPFDPGNPSLGQTLEGATQHTFALLHSLVQTFSGVAQMLESTFMATHSSFFAMVGVAEQLGQLRTALGSVLGLFGLVRWARDALAGRGRGALHGEFTDFVRGRPVGAAGGPPPPKPSKKPLVFFLLAVVGVPYAMHRLVRLLAERQQQQQQQLVPGPAGLPPLDPAQLTFARALYAFEASSPAELALKENEIVAVMGKLDAATGQEVDPRLEVETEWWKGRTREGREGWFPKKWVQILERRKAADAGAGKKVD